VPPPPPAPPPPGAPPPPPASPPPASPPPASPPPAPGATRTRLAVLVTPGGALALRSAAGKKVRALEPGAYVLRVRDRSRRCGLRLISGALTRRTGVSFRGLVVWRLTLNEGTLALRCGKKGVSVPVA
jgi:hypothetical protein